jgi:hypothetical protein
VVPERSRISTFFPKEARMKIWVSIERVDNRDGTYWAASWEEDGRPEEVRFYNDNPVVFGVPSPTVRIKGTAFKVEELLGYEGYQIELDLSTGEIGEG